MEGFSDVLRSLKYLRWAFSRPEVRSLGFLEMGFGIERRSRICRAHWKPHIERSKQLIATWLSTLDDSWCSSLLVLGAGHLLDIDLKVLAQRFRKITLVDANPACIPLWQRRARELRDAVEIDCREMEMTGVLWRWRQMLEAAARGGWDSALKALRDIPLGDLRPDKIGIGPSRFIESKPFTAAISLNTVSQIPLVWQDCVEFVFRRRFGRRTVKKREVECLEGYLVGGRLLVEQHLRDLLALKAFSVLLLSDVEYVHYRAARGYSRRYRTAPIEWVDGETATQNGHWKSLVEGKKEEVECECLDALCGIDPMVVLKTGEALGYSCPEYLGSWVWHIVPQGLEERNRGTLHRMAAWQVRKL